MVWMRSSAAPGRGCEAQAASTAPSAMVARRNDFTGAPPGFAASIASGVQGALDAVTLLRLRVEEPEDRERAQQQRGRQRDPRALEDEPADHEVVERQAEGEDPHAPQQQHRGAVEE